MRKVFALAITKCSFLETTIVCQDRLARQTQYVRNFQRSDRFSAVFSHRVGNARLQPARRWCRSHRLRPQHQHRKGPPFRSQLRCEFHGRIFLLNYLISNETPTDCQDRLGTNARRKASAQETVFGRPVLVAPFWLRLTLQSFRGRTQCFRGHTRRRWCPACKKRTHTAIQRHLLY